jgi:hypothetical protein
MGEVDDRVHEACQRLIAAQSTAEAEAAFATYPELFSDEAEKLLAFQHDVATRRDQDRRFACWQRDGRAPIAELGEDDVWSSSYHLWGLRRFVAQRCVQLAELQLFYQRLDNQQEAVELIEAIAVRVEDRRIAEIAPYGERLLTLCAGSETTDWRMIASHAVVRAALAGADNVERALEIADATKRFYREVHDRSDYNERFVDAGIVAQAYADYALLMEMRADQCAGEQRLQLQLNALNERAEGLSLLKGVPNVQWAKAATALARAEIATAIAERELCTKNWVDRALTASDRLHSVLTWAETEAFMEGTGATPSVPSQLRR